MSVCVLVLALVLEGITVRHAISIYLEERWLPSPARINSCVSQSVNL